MTAPKVDVSKVNTNAQAYKQNKAQFFGEKYSDRESVASGSIFQRNAANFYGLELTAGEKFNKQAMAETLKQDQETGQASVLNQQRLREHVRIIVKLNRRTT